MVVRRNQDAFCRRTTDLYQLWRFPGIRSKDIPLVAHLACLTGQQRPIAEVARSIDCLWLLGHHRGELRGEILVAGLVGGKGHDTLRVTGQRDERLTED